MSRRKPPSRVVVETNLILIKSFVCGNKEKAAETAMFPGAHSMRGGLPFHSVPLDTASRGGGAGVGCDENGANTMLWYVQFKR